MSNYVEITLSCFAQRLTSLHIITIVQNYKITNYWRAHDY